MFIFLGYLLGSFFPGLCCYFWLGPKVRMKRAYSEAQITPRLIRPGLNGSSFPGKNENRNKSDLWRLRSNCCWRCGSFGYGLKGSKPPPLAVGLQTNKHPSKRGDRVQLDVTTKMVSQAVGRNDVWILSNILLFVLLRFVLFRDYLGVVIFPVEERERNIVSRIGIEKEVI